MFEAIELGNVVNCTLYHISNACEYGYGYSSYIRLLNESGQIHCTLPTAKSRVPPFVSIPRLKVTVATVSVKISKMLKNELDNEILKNAYG